MPHDPLNTLIERVTDAVQRAHTPESRVAVLGGLLAVADEALAQLAEVPTSLKLAHEAVERWRATRDVRELEALRAAVRTDLRWIEAEGDGRTIHVAWTVWSLARVTESIETSPAVAAARARDCVTNAFQTIVWEPPGAAVPAAERHAAAEHAAEVLSARLWG